MNAYIDAALRQDDGKWVKHTQYHWSRYVKDQRVDYWPSKSKYMVGGKTEQGDVYAKLQELAKT